MVAIRELQDVNSSKNKKRKRDTSSVPMDTEGYSLKNTKKLHSEVEKVAKKKMKSGHAQEANVLSNAPVNQPSSSPASVPVDKRTKKQKSAAVAANSTEKRRERNLPKAVNAAGAISAKPVVMEKKENYEKFRLKRFKEKLKKKRKQGRLTKPEGAGDKAAVVDDGKGELKRPKHKLKNSNSTDKATKSVKSILSAKEATKQKQGPKPSNKYAFCDPKELLHFYQSYLKSLQLTAAEVSDYDFSDSVFDGACLSSASDDKNEFLERSCDGLLQFVARTEVQMGSPCVMIVCNSAERVIELHREIADIWNPKPRMLKLFARHKNLGEQGKTVTNSRIDVALVTPARALSLLEQMYLQTTNLKYLVIDWSFRNVKDQRLVDIKDTRQSLMSLLKSLTVWLKGSGDTAKIALL